jgi:hypothetical protein
VLLKGLGGIKSEDLINNSVRYRRRVFAALNDPLIYGKVLAYHREVQNLKE